MRFRGRNLAPTLAIAAVLIVGALVRLSRAEPPEDARFFTLGSLAKDLADDEKTFDAALQALGGTGASAFGLITEPHRVALKQLFTNKDYETLDQQPQLELSRLSEALQLLAQRRPFKEQRGPPLEAKPVSLDVPTGKTDVPGEPYLKEIGLQMTWGDRLDPDKRQRAADSERFAQVLDQLAMGDITIDGHATPRALLESLRATGHTVVVLDQRLAANFGDLERKSKPVATPLWVVTGRSAPDGQPVLMPVPHAQLVTQVRGPQVNADVTFFTGLDLVGDGSGGARFRPDVTADQSWCGGYVAHRYENEQALQVIDLLSTMRRELVAKQNEFSLPLDGYFELGVCTLAPAVVEQKLFGRVTLWPLTHDKKYFAGSSELDVLVRALPVDGRPGAAPPDDVRLAGSLPWRSLDAMPFRFWQHQLRSLRLIPERAAVE